MHQVKEQISDHLRPFCDINFELIEAKDVQNPKDYFTSGKQIQEVLKNVEAKKQTQKYEKTILVIDELNPEFEITDWSVYKPGKRFQVIFCLKYAFDDQKIKSKRKTHDSLSAASVDGSLGWNTSAKCVTEHQHVIVGKLQKGHRCSNQIRQLVYYLLIHSPDYERRFLLKDFNQGIHHSFDAKYRPSWIELKNVHVFISRAKTENSIVEIQMYW